MTFQRWHSACHYFSWLPATRAALFLPLCLFYLSLSAEVPVPGASYPLSDGAGHYRMDYRDHAWQLSLYSESGSMPTRHDLSDCRFCAAESVGDESDNCQMDGVFSLQDNQQSRVGVVCHVGAHSQRLLLFGLESPSPLKVLTGNYYLTLSWGRAGLEATYDRRGDNDEHGEQREIISAMNVMQKSGQSLLLDHVPRPLRTGPGASAPILDWLANESVQLVTESRLSGWQRVIRQDGTQGYLLAAGLPEPINEER